MADPHFVVAVLDTSGNLVNAGDSANSLIRVSIVGGGGGGVTGSISAGTTKGTLGEVVFSNSPTVTFGMDGQTVTASAVGGAGGGAALSAGTQSVNTGTVVFANSNGMTFGMLGSSQVTASYTVPSTAGLLSAINVSAGTTSNNLSALTFNNGGGVSFGLNASTVTATVATTYRASNDAIGLNTAQSNVTWTVNSAGLSLDARGYAGTGTSATNASITLNSNGLAISVAAPGGGAAVNVSAGTTSNNLQTIQFDNSNGVSFGLNGSTITGTVATNYAASDHSHGNPQLNLTNLSGTTASNSAGFTLSLSAAGGGAQYTALSFQNRQLGASTTLNSAGGQNSLWLAPIRLVAPVSASTIIGAMMSYSGTITSAATAQFGQTMRVGIWSQHTDPASTSRFDTWWTGGISITCWNSGTSSVSYAFSQTGGNTTSSSAGSNLLTASVMGGRLMLLPIGSTMSTGLYVLGVLNSTSSAGYSAAMSRAAMYMDNPLSLGMGTFGQATNNSIGYADGGTYGTTTGALPSSLALADIKAVANVMPFFKIGAI